MIRLAVDNTPVKDKPVSAFIAAHDLAVTSIERMSEFALDNEQGRGDMPVRRLSQLIEQEKLAMSAFANASVRSFDDAKEKARYLASLIENDNMQVDPEDIIAVLRSIAATGSIF